MGLALEGIRVVDLTDSIIGPFTTMLMASCGAEIIKVESRYHLGFRRVGPWGPQGNEPIPQAPEKSLDFSKINLNLVLSPTFAQLNPNKLSIVLNLDKPEGRELLKKLVKISDIVIDNLRFGIMEKWGLGYQELKQVKDDIIVASLQGMGRGPYEGWITWAMNLMSFTGFAHGWGHPQTDMTERVAARYYGDYIAGGKAAAAIVAALFHRALTGKGQYIELSQIESTMSVLGPAYLDYFVNNRVTPPQGNRHPKFAPYNCYQCKDENSWCVIAVRSEEEWKQFCKALNDPSWANDPKFSTMQSRLENVDELDQNIEGWTRQYTPHQVMRLLQYFGVAAGAVQNGQDLYYDIQLRDRGFMIEQDLPRLGSLTFTKAPLKLATGEAAYPPRAPLLGEHNDYVYRELLGLQPEEIKRLEETEVIF